MPDEVCARGEEGGGVSICVRVEEEREVAGREEDVNCRENARSFCKELSK